MCMKRAILIYNAISGDQSLPNKLDYIVYRFQTNDILLQPYRLNKNHTQLVELLKSGQFDFVIASGGDGTINYAGNIILKEKLAIPMGVIPSGTCNDFASILNIPNKLEDCLDIILKGKTKKLMQVL